MLRVDTPDLPERRNPGQRKWCYEKSDYIIYDELLPAEPSITQYVGIGSIYRLTPCTESTAREAANRRRREAPKMLNLRPEKSVPALPAADLTPPDDQSTILEPIKLYDPFWIHPPFQSHDADPMSGEPDVDWTVQRHELGDETEDHGEIMAEFVTQDDAHLFAEAKYRQLRAEKRASVDIHGAAHGAMPERLNF